LPEPVDLDLQIPHERHVVLSAASLRHHDLLPESLDLPMRLNEPLRQNILRLSLALRKSLLLGKLQHDAQPARAAAPPVAAAAPEVQALPAAAALTTSVECPDQLVSHGSTASVQKLAESSCMEHRSSKAKMYTPKWTHQINYIIASFKHELHA
jgi:hypothetical protein